MQATTKYIKTLDSDSFKAFLHALAQEREPGRSSLVSITLPIADMDPLAALELHHTHADKFYWQHPKNGVAIAAAGAAAKLRATGPDRFQQITRQKEQWKRNISSFTAINHDLAGPLFLGGYSFQDHNIGTVWKQFGAARFVLPEWVVVQADGISFLTLTIDREGKELVDLYQEIIEKITDFLRIAGSFSNGREHSPHAPTVELMPDHDERQRWESNVKKAKKLILQQKFQKIVLARSTRVKLSGQIHPESVVYRLRSRYPECFNFMIQVDEGLTFLGATPERLASFSDGVMTTEGLAGSISRGSSASEDEALAHSLLKSRKDLNEHSFVVRAIDSSLEPYSYSVKHSEKPVIKKLKNVQHLFTPISADIRKGVQIHQLIQQLHPTPAVGGYPANDALRFIQEIEQLDRGWYAAPVGWFNLNGFGEFAVAIRSALLTPSEATLYAGCGIVKDSDPATEWNETLLKLQPMLEAIQSYNEGYD
ncbi:MAG: isochorismate synthase [Balneolaceae bacterium]